MRQLTFSARTAWDTGESALAEATAEARRQGRPLLDLSLANPTRCGFDYDPHLLGALSDPAAMTYDPDPLGLLSARIAVCDYYREHGAEVRPQNLVLTTSTSEAYSFLFRLLCDPGDEVMVAQPSYPLFDFLAGLEDVTLQPYPLFYDFGWWIDVAELERRIGPRTRALLLVHPNNPTGHFTSTAERLRLEQICARHGLALIVDEVFLDYSVESGPVELGSVQAGPEQIGPVEPDPAEIASFACGPHPVLTFVVSGLSKIAALPQMKVGWLAGFGPHAQLAQAMERLEVIADTFLSMNAPAQLALPVWLAGREAIAGQVRTRVRANLALWQEYGLAPLPVQAGWSAVLRVPSWLDARPETLVRKLGVIVHAGEFYGFAGTGWIVVSLIVPVDVCRAGVQRLRAWIDQSAPR